MLDKLGKYLGLTPKDIEYNTTITYLSNSKFFAEYHLDKIIKIRKKNKPFKYLIHFSGDSAGFDAFCVNFKEVIRQKEVEIKLKQ